jgi:hypothetical protein
MLASVDGEVATLVTQLQTHVSFFFLCLFFLCRTILASVDGEVATLEKQLQTAKDTERKSLERRDKSAEVGTWGLGTWGLGFRL